MSLETWKAEYYPIRASECKKKDALAHSKLKWQGLKPANLAKHGVTLDATWRRIRDDTSRAFLLDGSTCALCKHYHKKGLDSSYADDRCDKCPLAKARNNVPCDAKYRGDDDARGGPYMSFIKTGNPVSMIRFLNKAEAFK